ncbi:MAG TPA: lipid II flippase MurJ [Bryobacteraceae bacterium]|nr:lipid II flippase MurJ [Bryobacteraceae bacterium]
MESPLIRGGLTIVAGVLTGNLLGFARVAVTAYLLGTHSRADSLAVAMGPIDTLNSVLINSVVFAFVPLLAASEERRVGLFRQLHRLFSWVFLTVAFVLMAAAPWLMRALAPGLDPQYFGSAVTLLRIFSLSTLAAGTAALYSALLYTDRRFAPAAFYQAALNVCTIGSALALWKVLGIYGFAIGYTTGAFAQLAVVYFATRRDLVGQASAPDHPFTIREILAKPAFFVVYATGLGLNMTFSRAWATHAGPGMAAAFDYCLRGVSVPLALLVNPISNSLLPEIARLRALFRWREAFRLIDRTIALTALVAVGGCAFALLFRQPAIAIMFQRGEFHRESTLLVSAVFLGLGPSLIGWSLMEISARSLFALDRPWPPVIAALVPVSVNVILTLSWHSHEPEWLGLGSTLGLVAGFLILFALAHSGRKRWLAGSR